MTAQADERPIAICAVIPLFFCQWLLQPYRAAFVLVGFLGATAADLFMPIYSGHLVDALTSGPYHNYWASRRLLMLDQSRHECVRDKHAPRLVLAVAPALAAEQDGARAIAVANACVTDLSRPRTASAAASLSAAARHTWSSN
ncbi:hypothetical protein [Bradyrhizobium stylosanthis]|uniref:hypothetical protein n=1 Tax=Bradyrhizobium stylosanthis TaxID=1803665 RepID=UPI0011A30540|nr:hypothetical protein [Bradyrhizobium stylosanthis]